MKITVLSLIVAGLLLSGLWLVCSTHAQDNLPPAQELPPERWENDIRTFEEWDRRNAWPEKPILFVGSSSARGWPTREFFPDLPVMNRGFGGAHIADVNYYFDRIVTPYAPELIVFYCGDNDITLYKPPERVLSEFSTFVGMVRQALPETQIIYIAIKPSQARAEHWPRMTRANDLVQAMCCREEGLWYFDGASCMMNDEGKPDPVLYAEDKLHLSMKGYNVWTKGIRPLIDRVLATAAEQGQTQTP